MTFAVGILYSTQELLRLVGQTALLATDFSSIAGRFELASPQDVLSVAQKCSWIEVLPNGVISLTTRGRAILNFSDASAMLRVQLLDLILIDQPAWARRLMNGREEAIPAMPSEVRQCFRESGLLGDWAKEIIDWWYDMSQRARFWRSERLGQVGRQAEVWSLEFEQERTGAQPYWQALDSSFAGYDIQSVVSATDAGALRIEVKGSELRPREAFFFFTQNECRVARVSGSYILHLWSIGDPRILFVVPFKEVEAHLPDNQGRGQWETTKIPFSAFSSYRAL